mgnify:FL=1
MGSKETTNVTEQNTSTQSMPQFQEDFLRQQILPRATAIAEREFTPYEGERIAGMTPLQQRALEGYGGLNAGAEQYGQASDIYGDLGGFQGQQATAANLGAAGQLSGANLGQYMSPYQQNVIDASLRTLGGAQEQALNQLGAQATAANAFGGSRQGIAEAETRKAYGQQASDLVTNQMQQGFMNAQNAAQSDIASRNQFATQQAQLQQQANLANQQAQMQAAGIRATGAGGLGATAGQGLEAQKAVLGTQMQAGETARSMDQARLDQMFSEFAREQDFPLSGLNSLLSAASGIPTGYGTTIGSGSSSGMTSSGGMGNYLSAAGSFGMGMGPQGFGIFK